VTNHHGFNSLKHEFIILTILKIGKAKTGLQGCLLSGGSRGESVSLPERGPFSSSPSPPPPPPPPSFFLFFFLLFFFQY
jgi:hypothetical protein